MDRGAWPAAGGRTLAPATRGGGPARSPVRLGLVFAVLAMLSTLPILAHGCHRGDHDDEPVVAPADRRAPERQ